MASKVSIISGVGTEIIVRYESPKGSQISKRPFFFGIRYWECITHQIPVVRARQAMTILYATRIRTLRIFGHECAAKRGVGLVIAALNRWLPQRDIYRRIEAVIDTAAM